MTSRNPLQQMFEALPPRYDLINRLFTLGMDKKWRARAIKECLNADAETMLDLCCGTADMALGYAMLVRNKTEVLGLDYSQPMLRIAVQKARISGANRISFIHGNAAQLPFKDNSINCVGISFAFRNLTYKNPLARPHLREVLRVLAPGGRYVIAESSQPKAKFMRWAFKVYVRYFVYWLGYLVSGNRSAYRYLSESAANFFTADEVKEMLTAAGFKQVAYHPQFFGATCIHVAIK